MAHSADGVKAHNLLLTYGPLSARGACWYYVWKAYDAAGAQNDLGATRTAYQAWKQSLGKHYDRNPPFGAAIWLGKRLSDGNMDGDVIIAGAFNGDHAATDQPTWYRVGRTTIEARMRLTGREYLGWTDHVGNAPIKLGATPAPAGTISATQRVAAALVNRRKSPDTKSAPLANPLTKGTVGNFNGWRHGQSVQGNDVWFRGISGNWFWSGGFTSKSTKGLKDLNPAKTSYPIVSVSNVKNIGDVRGLQKIANLYLGADEKTKIDNKWGPRSKLGFSRFINQKYGSIGNWLRAPHPYGSYVGNDQLGPDMTAALKKANAANLREL